MVNNEVGLGQSVHVEVLAGGSASLEVVCQTGDKLLISVGRVSAAVIQQFQQTCGFLQEGRCNSRLLVIKLA